MATYGVEITGLDEITSAFKKAPAIVKKYGNEAIKKSVLTLLAHAREEAPVDQGFLRGPGMQFSFGELTGLLENKAPYAMYVHEGTQPHYVPISAIQGWADRHGIPAFLVQRSIKQKGTKAQPFFKDSIEASQSQIDKFFNDALDYITNAL